MQGTIAYIQGLATRLLRTSALVAELGSGIVATASSTVAQEGAVASTAVELIVTVRKRDESLQDVPITIAVLSDATLQEYG